MQTLLNILPLSDLGVVLLILGIIALFMSFCGYILWNDLFRNKKVENH